MSINNSGGSSSSNNNNGDSGRLGLRCAAWTRAARTGCWAACAIDGGQQTMDEVREIKRKAMLGAGWAAGGFSMLPSPSPSAFAIAAKGEGVRGLVACRACLLAVVCGRLPLPSCLDSLHQVRLPALSTQQHPGPASDLPCCLSARRRAPTPSFTFHLPVSCGRLLVVLFVIEVQAVFVLASTLPVPPM